MTAELSVLVWSAVLYFVHLGAQGLSATAETGVAYNLSPRDDGREPRGVLAGRLRRAFANYRETFPLFAALALALAVTGRGGGMASTGAWLWLAARVLYLPLYAFGVPVARTAVWSVAALGLVMMLWRLAFS